MTVFTAINAVGTLIFAAVALFAIFYPQILSFYYRPRLKLSIVKEGFDTFPRTYQSIYVSVRNDGKKTAHGLIGLISVYDDKDNCILNDRIPAQRETEGYDEIKLHSYEEVKFLCLLNGSLMYGREQFLMITSYPFKLAGNGIPSINSLSNIGGQENVKRIIEGRHYGVNVTAVCDELTKPVSYRFKFILKSGKVGIE